MHRDKLVVLDCGADLSCAWGFRPPLRADKLSPTLFITTKTNHTGASGMLSYAY